MGTCIAYKSNFHIHKGVSVSLIMTALGGRNGSQRGSYEKAIVTHSGCCLSPRLREFLCGTPRTVLTEDAFDEDVLLSILPAKLTVTALQVCHCN